MAGKTNYARVVVSCNRTVLISIISIDGHWGWQRAMPQKLKSPYPNTKLKIDNWYRKEITNQIRSINYYIYLNISPHNIRILRGDRGYSPRAKIISSISKQITKILINLIALIIFSFFFFTLLIKVFFLWQTKLFPDPSMNLKKNNFLTDQYCSVIATFNLYDKSKVGRLSNQWNIEKWS